nr:MAG TPA: hypothetical protein [Caudoviricetes sp.]
MQPWRKAGLTSARSDFLGNNSRCSCNCSRYQALPRTR